MLCVPSSLDELLLLFATCFSRPTFRTFCALVVGQISQTRLRCVTGMLIGARLSEIWHHARAHRFFSHARWCVDELGLRVTEVIVSRLLGPGEPLVVPIDDTLAKRRGRKVFGCFWHHDATANSNKGSVAWGNNSGHRRDQCQAAVPEADGLPAGAVPALAPTTQGDPQAKA